MNKADSEGMTRWFVYVLRTASDRLYTGISTDVARRLVEHTESLKGAKSLRGQAPLLLVWQLEVPDRAAASRLEYRIKSLSRADKEKLVSGALATSSLYSEVPYVGVD